ncbi:MAG: Appr-p processing enzyme family protein [Bacteroidetes bacterium]|nr:Appr-p processing enzyme family protein [Bacteroidota bacterium]
MPLKTRIQLIKGDITQIQADAIVNAANTSLLGGGGVDGAIHRAGGPEILANCRKIILAQGGCRTGEAVITTAGNLPAEFVIHTVGPVWSGGTNDEEKKLSSCYKSSLKLAAESNCTSIAFPGISTGAYGFPKDKAAEIAVTTVIDFLLKNTQPKTVIFVCYDEEYYCLIQQKLNTIL